MPWQKRYVTYSMNTFTFCTLGSQHLDAVLELESAVLAVQERPELLRRNSREMWQACLLPPHHALGVRGGERLVALAVLYVPEPAGEEDLSACLQGMDCAGLRSANYKICLVHPDYRGHHLQQQLGERLETLARQQGIGLLCSTVSPLNIASLRSMEHLGYHTNCSLTKYGFPRLLLVKKI